MNAATNLIDDLRLFEAPQPIPAWWWALAIALAVAAGLLAWRLLSRGPRKELPVTAKVAEEDALAELAALRPLISMPKSRPYAIAVSGVVRRYIERRFGIRAPRQSTPEFLQAAQGASALSGPHRGNLSSFLQSCDFLKFAHALAEVEELEQIHQTAFRFITDTHPTPAPATAPAGTLPQNSASKQAPAL